MRSSSKIDIEIDLNDHDDAILNWVAEEFDPEDVFDEKVLEDWAEDNGWVRGD